MHPEASLRLIQILEKTVSPGMYVKRGKLIHTLIAVQTQNSLPMLPRTKRKEVGNVSISGCPLSPFFKF